MYGFVMQKIVCERARAWMWVCSLNNSMPSLWDNQCECNLICTTRHSGDRYYWWNQWSWYSRLVNHDFRFGFSLCDVSPINFIKRFEFLFSFLDVCLRKRFACNREFHPIVFPHSITLDRYWSTVLSFASNSVNDFWLISRRLFSAFFEGSFFFLYFSRYLYSYRRLEKMQVFPGILSIEVIVIGASFLFFIVFYPRALWANISIAFHINLQNYPLNVYRTESSLKFRSTELRWEGEASGCNDQNRETRSLLIMDKMSFGLTSKYAGLMNRKVFWLLFSWWIFEETLISRSSPD